MATVDDTINTKNLETSRKREANETLDKCETIKKAKLEGDGSVKDEENTTEQEIEEQDCGCKLHCYERCTYEERKGIFKQFKNLKSKRDEDIHLQSHIEKLTPKRKRPRNPEHTRPKNHTFKYFIATPSSNKLYICKKAFVHLHGVTESRVKRLCRLLSVGHVLAHVKNGTVSKKEVVRKIHQHIKSFPAKMSRYNKKAVDSLDTELNIKVMHQMFQSEYPTLNVKYNFYLRIFNEILSTYVPDEAKYFFEDLLLWSSTDQDEIDDVQTEEEAV